MTRLIVIQAGERVNIDADFIDLKDDKVIAYNHGDVLAGVFDIRCVDWLYLSKMGG